ncbi:hypothetical protein T12_2381 [Trichinella patagoniensis]|uniref:Uncharacterized protein n=1 Tax=Trichinella patagoniensis TaxID=990121 RepID=A0A0V1A1B0_9BILA|nr:hypothetical protein T12_2381 [Trichinella patagoniensis]
MQIFNDEKNKKERINAAEFPLTIHIQLTTIINNCLTGVQEGLSLFRGREMSAQQQPGLLALTILSLATNGSAGNV